MDAPECTFLPEESLLCGPRERHEFLVAEEDRHDLGDEVEAAHVAQRVDEVQAQEGVRQRVEARHLLRRLHRDLELRSTCGITKSRTYCNGFFDDFTVLETAKSVIIMENGGRKSCNIPGGDAECLTGNGIKGLMGPTSQPVFPFPVFCAPTR